MRECCEPKLQNRLCGQREKGFEHYVKELVLFLKEKLLEAFRLGSNMRRFVFLNEIVDGISAQQVLAQIVKEHKKKKKLIVLESRSISVRMVSMKNGLYLSFFLK